MSDAIDFRITATDLASQKFAQVNKEVTSLGSKIKGSILTGVGLGAGISAFNLLGNAAHAAVGFIEDSVRAAAEDEASVASLTAALKANVTGYNGNNAAIEKVINSRLRLGFTDDEQRAQLAALVAMTKDSTAALEIEGIAMDAAAITGKDFGSINIALGKAFEGNTAALKKLGIVVDKGVSGYDLLSAVQKRFAGGAEAASNTTAGAARAMAAEFDKLQEDIGAQLLPVLRDLFKFLASDVIPALKSAIPVVKELVPIIGIGLGVVAVNALRGLATQAKLTSLALKTLLPIAIIAGALEMKGAIDDSMRSMALAEAKTRLSAGAYKVLLAELEKSPDDWGKAAAAAEAFSLAVDGSNQAARGAEPHWRHFGNTVSDVSKSMTADIAAGFNATKQETRDGMTEIHSIMAGSGPAIASAAKKAITDPVWKAAQEAKVKAWAEAGKIPQAMADAMLADQQKLKDASKQLVDFMAQALSPAQERARALSFLASQAYKDGLASGIPAVVIKTTELRNQMMAVLTNTGGAWSGGINLATAWKKGLISGLQYAQISMIRELGILKANLYGRSPPKEGPLKDIDKGGFNIGKAWATNFIAPIRDAIGSIGGMTAPGFGSAAAAGSSRSGGAGGAVTVTINVNAPLGTPAGGKALAAVIVPEVVRAIRRQRLSLT